MSISNITSCASSTKHDEETLWNAIVREVNEEHTKLCDHEIEEVNGKSFVSMFRKNPALCYLKQNIYPVLLPVLKHTFQQILLEDVLTNSHTKFHPLDHITYLLWNMNPNPPELKTNPAELKPNPPKLKPTKESKPIKQTPQFRPRTLLYEIPFVRDTIPVAEVDGERVSSPRPIYPSSWLWSLDKAAEVIQKCARGMAVRRRKEVEELRRFWNILEMREEKMKRCAVHKEN